MIDKKEWSSIDHFCQAYGNSRIGPQLDTIYISNHAKFDQNDHLRDMLLSTQGPFSPTGYTSDWRHVTLWQHWHGRVLQRLREEFRPAQEQDQCLLQYFQQEFAVMGFVDAVVKERVESIAREFKDLRQPRHFKGSTMDGIQLDFYLSPLERIGKLRRQCADRLVVTVTQVKLLFGEETLVDTQTLGEVGMSDGDNFMIIIDSRTGRWRTDTLGGAVTATAKQDLLLDIQSFRRADE